MDDVKLRLSEVVAAELRAAPASDTKDELIEELSDNLYRRFLDMTGAGVPEEEAFQRAMDDLGDVDELLAYLGVEPASQGPDVTIGQKDGQTRITTQDGQTVVINGGNTVSGLQGSDPQRIVINTEDGPQHTITYGAEANSTKPDSAPAAGEEPQAAGETRAEAEAAHAQAQSAAGERGNAHYDYSGEIPQSDLDAILSNVSEICRVAMDQAKDAVKQAKEAIKRRTTLEKDDKHMKVHFNTHVDAPPAPPAPPEPPEAPIPPEPPVRPAGWEFEAELDSDQGRFFAGAGPKERKDVVYGFGYDKAKGGFFAQWGEWKGECQAGDPAGCGPHFTGEDSYIEHQDDGSYSVTALRDLRGIEIHTNAGDVSIHVSEAPDAGVIIGGDVDDLDVTCSADGVLTIREGRTASSSFFSRRGICSADVELFIPARHWDSIRAATTSGDVDIDKGWLDIGELFVQTGSGDLNVQLSACGQLHFKSGSGDLGVSGSCGSLYAETASGDVELHGHVDDAVVKTASGDVELEHSCGRLHVETVSGDIRIEGMAEDAVLKSSSGEIGLAGAAGRITANSISGDVQLEADRLPETMQLSSKSGDVEAHIPDEGPFSARMMTTSGEIDCEFHMHYVDGMFVYGDGSGPAYSLTTVSGSVSLERR